MIGRLAGGALIGAAAGGAAGTIPGLLASANFGYNLGPLGKQQMAIDPETGAVLSATEGALGEQQVTLTPAGVTPLQWALAGALAGAGALLPEDPSFDIDDLLGRPDPDDPGPPPSSPGPRRPQPGDQAVAMDLINGEYVARNAGKRRRR